MFLKLLGTSPDLLLGSQYAQRSKHRAVQLFYWGGERERETRFHNCIYFINTSVIATIVLTTVIVGFEEGDMHLNQD